MPSGVGREVVLSWRRGLCDVGCERNHGRLVG